MLGVTEVSSLGIKGLGSTSWQYRFSRLALPLFFSQSIIWRLQLVFYLLQSLSWVGPLIYLNKKRAYLRFWVLVSCNVNRNTETFYKTLKNGAEKQFLFML
jgi:hypothetical protein